MKINFTQISDHLKRKIPDPFKKNLRKVLDIFLWDSYFMKSYSQEGEDAVLSRYFESKYEGFYVDVGAHHPMRFSNTYNFYKRGWYGLNIDAMPGSMQPFEKKRPRDINLEQPVGTSEMPIPYYIFNEPALNGFDANLSEKRDKDSSIYSIVQTIELSQKRLSQILEMYLPNGKSIDFLSIDVEGRDLDVLRSNNWNKFRPKVILVEILDKNPADDPVNLFLNSKGYYKFANTINTAFYEVAK